MLMLMLTIVFPWCSQIEIIDIEAEFMVYI